MPKARPIYQAGQYYHFYNRGRSRLKIFSDVGDYSFVLRKLKSYSQKLFLSIIAYCLMPNHYHFLLRQNGEKEARLLPQYVFNSYSKVYNQKYQHSGTLFEVPYKVKEIQDSIHLIHLCRYIHANPVKAGMVSSPADWQFSNYLEWIGQRNGKLMDQDFISNNFSSTKSYKRFVFDYLHGEELPKDLRNYLVSLG